MIRYLRRAARSRFFAAKRSKFFCNYGYQRKDWHGWYTSWLCLHKERGFSKLYNQHAMLFTENIKPLKIKSRFIKVVNQQMYSCGFPMTIIEDVKKQLCAIGGELDASDKLLMVTGINREKKGALGVSVRCLEAWGIPVAEWRQGFFIGSAVL